MSALDWIALYAGISFACTAAFAFIAWRAPLNSSHDRADQFANAGGTTQPAAVDVSNLHEGVSA